MEHEHLNLNDAYDLVKRQKSDVSPNFSFMGQLLEFERRLNIPETPSSASSSLSSTSSLEMEISAFWDKSNIEIVLSNDEMILWNTEVVLIKI